LNQQLTALWVARTPESPIRSLPSIHKISQRKTRFLWRTR
jgi:hypothetical protein